MSIAATTTDTRTPVTLITGFLGSGKTTLLNHLLRDPAFAGTAVIINEFGSIALDHDLVSETSENILLLQSGCLCCSIRGDLIETLQDLLERRALGEIARFDRVAIETTGLADPVPILHTLMTDQTLMAQYRLDGIVVTVDAVTALATIDGHREASKQVAVADLILLTKTDLATAAMREAVEQRLGETNPAAPVVAIHDGAIDPTLIFAAGEHGLTQVDKASPQATGDTGSVNHTADVHAVSLTIDQPLKKAILDLWLDTANSLAGPELLRMKGLVSVEGETGPLVIHGVQHILHPPLQLQRWPSDDHRTRVVFIARNAPAGVIEGCVATLKSIAAGGGSAPLRAPLVEDRSGLLVAQRPAWRP